MKGTTAPRRLLSIFVVLIISLTFCFALPACSKKEEAKKEPAVEKKPAKKLFRTMRKRRMKVDMSTLPDDLPAALKIIAAGQPWESRKSEMANVPEGSTQLYPNYDLKMTREILLKSFDLGCAFLVKNQKPAGNFGYMYDWLEKKWVEDDNQVRQAGALWGVALCNHYKPDPKYRAATKKGLKFWFDQTIEGPQGTLTVKYQDENRTESGTVALIALALIDYLRTDQQMTETERKEMSEKLAGYLHFLQWMQLDNGLISQSYYPENKKRRNNSSPYFDGESMLAMCKAARILGYKELVPTIERLARAAADKYLLETWKSPKDLDATVTKGFYQWGSMSYAEYYLAQWKDYEVFGDVTLRLAWWMMHVHETLKKGRNHAYALEGLVSAYRIARERKDVDAMADILYITDRSFYKLTTWQIAGPLASENSFLQDHPTTDPTALGGIMNAKKKTSDRPRKPRSDVQHELRIDVTQHQMHAVVMALEYIYNENPKKD